MLKSLSISNRCVDRNNRLLYVSVLNLPVDKGNHLVYLWVIGSNLNVDREIMVSYASASNLSVDKQRSIIIMQMLKWVSISNRAVAWNNCLPCICVFLYWIAVYRNNCPLYQSVCMFMCVSVSNRSIYRSNFPSSGLHKHAPYLPIDIYTHGKSFQKVFCVFLRRKRE